MDTEEIVRSFTQADVNARKIVYEMKKKEEEDDELNQPNRDEFKFTIGIAGGKQQIQV